MSVQQPGLRIGSLVANGDLSGNQFNFVKLNASGKVIVASAAGEGVIGVLQNKPTANQPCEIMVNGISKVKVGAAVTAGAQIMTNASALAITAATAGSAVVGFILETAGGANEIVSAFINCGGDIV